MTDLYELTMMAGYYRRRAWPASARPSSFSSARCRTHRAYLVFAGLEQAIGDLLDLAFSAEQIEAIRQWPDFRHVDEKVMDTLATLRFEGDVWSVPEGTVVFAGETLLPSDGTAAAGAMGRDAPARVAGLPDAGGFEGRRDGQRPPRGDRSSSSVPRRGPRTPGGLLAARAAYIAGFTGTSHVEAARRLGIPASGTMAHSWVQSFATESEAFAAFARVFPENTTLLVDTYDTLDRRSPRRRDRAPRPGHPDR